MINIPKKSFSTFLVDEENVKYLRGRMRLDMGQYSRMDRVKFVENSLKKF